VFKPLHKVCPGATCGTKADKAVIITAAEVDMGQLADIVDITELLANHIEYGLQARLKYWALIDIEQLVAAAAAKAYQQFTITLALIQADARSAAIAQRRADERGVYLIRFNTGIALELVKYLLLLVFALGLDLQMLQVTTAALVKVTAGGKLTLGAGFEDFQQTGFVMALVSCGDDGAYPLTGKCARDKGGFALVAGNTAPLMAQPVDIKLKRLLRRGAPNCIRCRLMS
jgi:hypothetical protein